MTEETIDHAERECQRFLDRLTDLRLALKGEDGKQWRRDIAAKEERVYLRDCPAQTGSLRRASLDLTRALADMRKP